MFAVGHRGSSLHFDLSGIKKTYENHSVHPHAGLTMVVGRPLGDESFRKRIIEEQQAIKEVFKEHSIEDLLILYDVDNQIHATIIELAGQHNKERADQLFLEDKELEVSCVTRKPMNLNYFANWIKKVEPFEVEINESVYSGEARNKTLYISSVGKIFITGRGKDREALCHIRADFEDSAGIAHAYGKDHKEFYFCIGLLKPDERVMDEAFRKDLEDCINARRPHIQLALKVDSVKLVMYQNFSLDKAATVWESKELKFQQEPDLPQQDLITTVKTVRQRVQDSP